MSNVHRCNSDAMGCLAQLSRSPPLSIRWTYLSFGEINLRVENCRLLHDLDQLTGLRLFVRVQIIEQSQLLFGVLGQR